ncbi:MAG: hypothetical protein R2789_11805 [Microthrixaceae bacterium]
MHPTFASACARCDALLDPVVDALDRVAGAAEVLIGIHVCPNADWRDHPPRGCRCCRCLPTPPDRVGTVDTGPARQRRPHRLGAVPVDRPLGTSAETLWRHLAATWRDLASAGVDRDQLLRRSLVAPSDGLGAFAPEQVAGVVSVVDARAAHPRARRFDAHSGAGLTMGDLV